MKFNRIYKKLLMVGVISTLAILNLGAQQQPQYTQYMYNTMSLNAGYAGTKDTFEATLLHRSQWVGVDGAPSTQVLGMHSSVGPRVGLGGYIINESIGPANQIDVNLVFAYKLPISNTTTLSLGINAGANMLNVDWSKGMYLNQQDAIFNQNISNRIRPIIGSGAFLYAEKWYFGLSVPNFLKKDFYNDSEEAVLDTDMHYYLMGGYVFNVSDNVLFKPAAMVKVVQGAPLTVDVSANFLLQERVTLGVAYRYDDAVSGLVGIQINKNFFLGYSYDYTTTELNKYSNGSHEFILRYTPASKVKNAISPRFY